MIIKTRSIEVYEIHYEDQLWVLSHEKDIESDDEYYVIKDSEGIEVVDDDLFDEIVEYFETDQFISFDQLETEDDDFYD